MQKKTNPDIFRPVDVPDRIKPYVRRALVADTDQIVDMDIDIRATGYHYFGWVWRGRWQGCVNGATLFDSATDGPCMVTGQIGKAAVVARMQGAVGQIFLEFSALGHVQLLGITGAQLLLNPKAPDVLNPSLKPHVQRLIAAGDMDIDARIALMADVLSALPKHPVPEGIAKAVGRMEAAEGDIRISVLLGELGLAERKFRTDFEKLVGLTPKVFCTTLQINSAFNQLLTQNCGDLASVAAQSGFADQAHFTRAFGEFLGKAPKGFLEDVEATLALFVGQSRG